MIPFKLESEGEDEVAVPRRESTVGEVLGASLGQGLMATDTANLYNTIKKSFASEDDVMDHQELNKQFPDMEVPFNKPTSLSVAKEITKRDQRRKDLARVIEEGPDNSFLSAASFGAAMVPQIFDPVGLASGAFVEAGMVKAVGHLMKGNLARKALTIGSNVAGNVASEVAITQPAMNAEQRDVDAYDGVKNAVLSGIAFPIVLGGLGKVIKWAQRGDVKGVENSAKLAAYADAQLESGRLVDIEPAAIRMAKDNLPDIKAELEEMKARPDTDPIKVQEMEQDIREIESLPEPDRVKAIESHNSDAAEMYYDPRAKEILEKVEKELIDDSQYVNEITKKNEELIQDLDIMAKNEVLDAKDVEDIKSIKEEKASIEVHDEIAKATSHCLKGA